MTTRTLSPWLPWALASGFDAITSLNSNGVRASKIVDNSVFGCGVYGASRAPHCWRSKEEVILNNFFPVKKAWEKRTEGIDGIEWPRPKELHSDQDQLREEQVDHLLRTKFGEDLLRRRKGLTDYCVALVCDRDGAKDILQINCSFCPSCLAVLAALVDSGAAHTCKHSLV
eukprot:Skav210106  [mRNA]  locus=scaffold2194:36311:37097:+ [translate_table: standard]